MTPTWAELTSFENLHAAATAALRGKRGQRAAAAFHARLEDNLFALQRELRRGAWRPQPYRCFWVHEPKRRLISAAAFVDRVVHHAWVRTVEPSFERRFIHHSYACRVGKGNQRALSQFKAWARAHRFVLKLDVRKFFPTIDHVVLRGFLRRVVRDPDVLALADRIIGASGPQEWVVQHFPGDELLTPLSRARGLPIGNLTSQFFGNVYLDPLDHFVVDHLRLGAYLRYADDVCIFADDAERLRGARAAIAERLATHHRLRLNEGKSRLRRVGEGIEFLGFVVRPSSVRLNATAVRRTRRRFAELRAAFAHGRRTLLEVSRSIASVRAHAAQGDTAAYLRRALAASWRRAPAPSGPVPVA